MEYCYQHSQPGRHNLQPQLVYKAKCVSILAGNPTGFNREFQQELFSKRTLASKYFIDI